MSETTSRATSRQPWEFAQVLELERLRGAGFQLNAGGRTAPVRHREPPVPSPRSARCLLTAPASGPDAAGRRSCPALQDPGPSPCSETAKQQVSQGTKAMLLRFPGTEVAVRGT